MSTFRAKKDVANRGGISATKLLSTTALTAAGVLAFSSTARAQLIDPNTTPTGGEVVSGGITIEQQGTNTDIYQQEQNGRINWQSFDHGENAVTEFHQPNSSSWTINKVIGNVEVSKKTIIDGKIIANGNIGIIDQNGVLYGPHADIQLNGKFTTSGELNESKFDQDGKIEITNVGNGGGIEIQEGANISIGNAGLAAFVAPTVINSGVISAKMGTVAMAAGETVTLDMYGDGLVEVGVEGKLNDALIENKGAINAEGGTVQITALAAKDVVDNIINNTGVINASSATQQGGKIILGGGDSGVVANSGTLNVSGKTGGKVDVRGHNVLVSGDIKADGEDKGGNVTIWGDHQTMFTGDISALGEDGFVETSGGQLGVHGNVTLSQGGTWLLDPTDLWIMPGTADGGPDINGNPNPFSPDDSSGAPPADDSWYWVGVDYINAALNNNANVTLQTHANGTRAGDIQVNADILKTTAGNATLRLEAHDDIDVNNSITATLGQLNVELISDYDNAGGTDSNIAFHNGADINSNGGNVLLQAPNRVDINGGSVIDAAGGNINIAQKGAFNSVDSDSLRTSGTGTISLNQNSGGYIQNAISAIQNTGAGLNTVNVGAGTYNENVLVNQSNILVRSNDGRDTTIVNGLTGGNLGTFVIGAGINNTQIGTTGHGFTINGFDNGNPGIENAAVYYQGAHTTSKLQGNKIVANGDEAILTEYGQANNGITIDGNIITGNTFTGADGAWGTGGDQFVTPNTPRQLVALNFGNSNVTFTNNDVTGNAGDRQLVAIESSGTNSVHDNFFDGLSTAAALRIRGTNFDVYNNRIDGNGRGKGIESDKNGVNLTIGSTNFNLGNIIHDTGGDAISVKGASGTVKIQNNIIGWVETAPYSNLLIAGSTDNVKGDGILVDTTNNAEILSNYVMETTGAGAIEVLGSDGVKVTGNTISNSDNDGIRMQNDSNITVESNSVNGTGRVNIYGGNVNTANIKNNTVNNDGLAGYGSIHAEGGSNWTISGNDIDFGDFGIRLNGVTGTNVVDNNKVDNVTDDGIRADYTTTLAVTNNKVGKNGGNIGGDGIEINYSTPSQYDVLSNQVDHAAGNGILVDPPVASTPALTATYVNIEDNNVDNSGLNGIYSLHNSDVTITNNIVNHSGLDGILAIGGSNIRIGSNASNGNTVSNSGANGIDVQTFGGTALISNNTVENTVKDGISVVDTNGVQILNNKIGLLGVLNSIGSGAGGGDGIFVSNSDNATIKGNKTANTHYNGPLRKGSGILVVKSDGATIGGLGANEGNDVALAGSDGIVVRTDGDTANNTKIIGNTIHGLAGSRTGIYTEFATNTLIDSNNVSGTGRYAGIYEYGGSNATITNNILNGNDEIGILIQSVGGTNKIDNNTIDNTGNNKKTDGDGTNSGDGIRVDSSSSTTVSNNKVGTLGGAGNIKGNGISILNSAGATVSTNTVSNVTGSAVFIDPSPATIVIGNILSGGLYGVEVTADSDNSIVKGNTIFGQTSAGIYVHNGSDNATIGGGVGEGNTITEASNVWGIYVEGGNTQNVVGNTINGSYVGIRLIGTGNGANVTGNTVGQTTGSASDGIELVSTGTATVSGNHVYNAGWDGINVNSNTGAINVTGNDIHNTVGASGIAYVGGSTVGGTIDNNTIENSARLGIYSDRTENLVITSNTINNSGTANINGPFGPFTDAIFIEGGKNVTIGDLTTPSKGNIINGATGAGIRVGGGGNYAAASTTGIVIGNNKIQNVGADGIHVQDSAGVKITSNAVGFDSLIHKGSAGNIKGDGIFIINSDGALINKNKVTETVSTGGDKGSSIQVLNSDNVTIGGATSAEGNKLSNSGWDYIRVDAEGGTLDNLLIGFNEGKTDNAGVDGAARVGIYAEGLTHSTIDNNKISDTNRYGGIYLAGGSNDKITNNTINNIDEVGILLLNTTGSNLIDKNTITNTGKEKKSSDGQNSGDGIQVRNDGGTNVAFTTISNNKIGLTGGANNINGDGISVYNSAYTLISGNQVSNTVGNGTFIDPSPHSTIKGNTYTNVGLNGIYSIGNDDITIGGTGANDGNTITNAGLNGIFVDDSGIGQSGYTAKILKNKISVVGTTTASDGILVKSGSNAQIDGNTVFGTDGGNSFHVGNTNGKTGATRDGIHVENNKGVVVSNNTIAGGNGSFAGTGIGGIGAANDGIYVKGSENANINHNTINGGTTVPVIGGVPGNGAGQNGIEVVSSKGAQILSNNVSSVGHDGILATGSDNLLIQLNTIGNGLVAGAGWNGIEVSGGKKAIIDQNTVKGGLLNAAGAGNDGIHVDGNQSVKITTNTIKSGVGLNSNGAVNDGINVNNSGAQETLLTNHTADGATITGNTVTLAGLSAGAGHDGIHVVNSAGGLFGGLAAHVDNNTVNVVGNDGIFVSKTTGVNTLHNTVTKTGDDGIEIDDSDNANTELNTVTLAGDVGILIDPSSNTVTDHNTVTGSGSFGIQVDGGLTNTVSNNTVSVSGNDGIRIDHNAFTKVLHNTVTASNGDGIEVNGGVTVPFLGTLGANVVDDNTVSVSYNGHGINFHDSNLGKITNNHVSVSLLDGINANKADGLTVDHNDVKLSGDDGIEVTNSTLVGITNNTVTTSVDDGITTRAVDVLDISKNNVSLSLTGDGIDVDGADVFSIDDNTVTTSLLGNGIKLTNSNVGEVDHNNVSLSGIDGIYGNNLNVVTITDNTVTGSLDDGIDVDGATLSTIDGNHISLSILGNGIEASNFNIGEINDNDVTTSLLGNGIDLRDSSIVEVAGNDVSLSGIDGIYGKNLNLVSITDNTVTGSLDDGIDVDGALLSAINGNHISLSILGNGIEASNFNIGEIDGNDVTLSLLGNGIDLRDSNLVDISDNNVSLSGQNGLFVDPSFLINISGNTFTLSGADGIHVEDVIGLAINGNHVSLSGDDGIDADGVALYTIDGNDVTGQLDNGIELSNALIGEVNGNTVTLSLFGDGINTTNTLFTDILGNTVTLSGDDGIDVSNALFTDISGNTSGLNGNNGIELSNAVFTNIEGNLVGLNLGDGIHTQNTAFTDILGNIVVGNLDDGIDTDNSLFQNIIGNVVALSGSNGIEVSDDLFGNIDANFVTLSLNDGINVNGGLFTDVNGNFVSLSGDDGIDVNDTFGADINGNLVIGSLNNGIEVSNSPFVDVNGNLVLFSGHDGINVNNSYGADITNNIVAFALRDGINVRNSDDVDVDGNLVALVGRDGIHARNADSVNINANFITLTGDDGIDVRNSDRADITHNGILFTLGDGIQVRNSDFAEIDDNFIRFAGDDGIDYENGHDADISRNDIRFVNNSGIEIDDSSFITADNNIISDADVGILIDPSHDIFVTNNKISNNNIGLYAAGGGNGYIEVTGNIFTNNVVGARFESGIIDLTKISTTAAPDGNFYGNQFFAGTDGKVAMEFEAYKGDETQLSLVREGGGYTYDGTPYDTFPTFPPSFSLNYGGTIGHQYFEGYNDPLTQQIVTLGRDTFIDPISGEAIWLNAGDSTYANTPVGTFSPADAGYVLTADQYDYLESMFFHNPDAAARGIFFFGIVPAAKALDARKFFDEFDPFANNVSGLNVTITGLPRLGNGPATGPGTVNLNAITPAAGEETGTIASAAQAADIEPAAGPDAAPASSASCWADAIAGAGGGKSVNYSYGGTFDESITAAAGCSAGAQSF